MTHADTSDASGAAPDLVPQGFIAQMEEHMKNCLAPGGGWRQWEPSVLQALAALHCCESRLLQGLHAGDRRLVRRSSAEMSATLVKINELYGAAEEFAIIVENDPLFGSVVWGPYESEVRAREVAETYCTPPTCRIVPTILGMEFTCRPM